MRPRKLTAVDVCAVTGYSRDQFRALLQELTTWSAAPGERKAREFAPNDLIVLNIVHTLDTVIGMRRKAIAAILPMLQAVLLRPRKVAANAKLTICFEPLKVEYIDGNLPCHDGLVLALEPVFKRVDGYLGVRQVTQINLRFGPELIRVGRKVER